jgi:hypothetical protein
MALGVQHGLEGCSMALGVQHGLVVSVLGCCTAAPGSNPARHPTLGPAGRKLFAQMQESVTQLRKKITQQENIPRKNNVYVS